MRSLRPFFLYLSVATEETYGMGHICFSGDMDEAHEIWKLAMHELMMG